MEKIMNLVRQDGIRGGCEDLIAAGVVLTGGSSIMEGVPDLAQHVFQLPVRRAHPQNIGGLVDVVKSPMFSTGVGLIHYGMRERKNGDNVRSHDFGVYHKVKGRFKDWIQDLF